MTTPVAGATLWSGDLKGRNHRSTATGIDQRAPAARPALNRARFGTSRAASAELMSRLSCRERRTQARARPSLHLAKSKHPGRLRSDLGPAPVRRTWPRNYRTWSRQQAPARGQQLLADALHRVTLQATHAPRAACAMREEGASGPRGSSLLVSRTGGHAPAEPAGLPASAPDQPGREAEASRSSPQRRHCGSRPSGASASPVGSCWVPVTGSAIHREIPSEELRWRLQGLLGWSRAPVAPTVGSADERARDGYVERLIEYRNSEHEIVRAFLLVPERPGPLPGMVVHHQHNGERHLGKSEVMGVVGDPIQAFAPRLARNGFVVLAPDAVCFEDRRRGAHGTAPDPRDDRQHYDEMAYRLVQGSLLMSLVVADAALAVSVLAAQDLVDPERVGMLGHSMGGHTTLFTAALDQRVRLACVSGALCGYRARIDAGVGIELAQIIPGIAELTDFDGLLGLIAPRPVLVVSADEDPYSFDAANIVGRARIEYERQHVGHLLTHARYAGGHPPTEERVHAMLEWANVVTALSQPSD